MGYEGLAETERVQGAILGLTCGDAPGATLEFEPRHRVPAAGQAAGGVPDTQRRWWLTNIVGGGWLRLPPGHWTDDTAMALAVAEGILEEPDHPVPHVGERFLAWYRSHPPDVGNTIRLRNGSLMRTLPVGLAYKDPACVQRHAAAISRMTHWDRLGGGVLRGV